MLPQVFKYLAQDKEPSFHSWRRPKIKIIKNINELRRRGDRTKEDMRIGAGISKTISTSKTRKITANKKKRVENGIRALFFGSNPHSNGDAFSRSIKDRALRL